MREVARSGLSLSVAQDSELPKGFGVCVRVCHEVVVFGGEVVIPP